MFKTLSLLTAAYGLYRWAKHKPVRKHTDHRIRLDKLQESVSRMVKVPASPHAYSLLDKVTEHIKLDTDMLTVEFGIIKDLESYADTFTENASIRHLLSELYPLSLIGLDPDDKAPLGTWSTEKMRQKLVLDGFLEDMVTWFSQHYHMSTSPNEKEALLKALNLYINSTYLLLVAGDYRKSTGNPLRRMQHALTLLENGGLVQVGLVDIWAYRNQIKSMRRQLINTPCVAQMPGNTITAMREIDEHMDKLNAMTVPIDPHLAFLLAPYKPPSSE